MPHRLNLLAEDVEDIYFTEALSDPRRTEFFVEYRDQQDRWRRYLLYSVTRARDGRALIVEIKREHDRERPIDGFNGRKAMKVKEWVEMNPERLRYEIIFTGTDVVPRGDLARAVQRLGVSESPDAAAARIGVPRGDLEAFCEKWKVAELALVGSAAEGTATADSDVDLLVTFADDARVTLMTESRMQRELEKLFGRKVDLVNRASIESDENPLLRERLLREVRPLYSAAN